MADRVVVVSGNAKMPEGTSARSLHEVLTVGVGVDVATHTVVAATCSLATTGGQEWLRRNLVGQNLLQEPADFVQLVERDYWGSAQAAIVHCYREIVRRYRQGLAAEGHPEITE